MKRSKIITYALLMAVAVGALGVCTHKVQAIRKDLPAEHLRAQALMVNPHLLKTISGEFQGLLADYLLLKASVFLGGAWKVTPEDIDAVSMMFKQSLVLDPLFFQTGYYIQGNLAWRKGMHARATDLLDYHADHREWDWEPRFYVGFNTFYYLNDSEAAAMHLKIASDIPGSPPIVGTLGARLLHRASQTATAITMLEAMYERTDNAFARKSLMQRLEAYRGVYVIEQAINRYSTKFGYTPPDLDALVKGGILNQLPDNPLGESFLYEPETNRVYYDDMHKQ